MSVRVMDRVWRHSRARQGDLLVLLAIADFADDDGRAFPSVATLAEKSRLKERMTQYAIRNLVEHGELEIEHNAGPKGCHIYHVRTRESDAEVAPVQNLRGAISDRGGATHCAKGVQPIAPKPSLTVKEPSGTTRRKNATMPTCDELREFASIELHLPASDGEHLFHHWTENGFTRRDGSKSVPIRDWKATARKWKSGGWFPSQKNGVRPQTDALGRRLKSDGLEASRLMAQHFDPSKVLRQEFDPREVL